MSGPRGLTTQDRGYIKNTGTQFNYEKSKNGYMQTLLLKQDDCAMACDNEQTCKSFQVFNDGNKGDRSTCVLSNIKSSNFSGSAPNSSQKNMNQFDKPPTTIVPNGIARIFQLRNALNQSPDGSDPGILLDDGGVFYNGTDTKDQTCISSTNWCDYQSNPTGMYVAPENVPAGTNHSSSSMQLHTGVNACNIPGVVVNTVPTDKNGTDRPWQTQWMDNSYIYCGYNTLDNDWIAKNWDVLSSYLKDTTNVSYTFPQRNVIRPDNSSQTGISKVNSVTVAQNDYCNTVPLSTFTTDTTANSRCKNVKTGAGGDDDWRQFLLDRAAKEDWSKDRVPDLVTYGCNTDNQTIIHPHCTNAIGNLQTNDKFSQNVITTLNAITTADKYGVSQDTKNKIDEYCAKNESATECGCRNSVKYGVDNCTPDKAGCADMIEFKKLKNSIPDVNSATFQFLKAINLPRELGQSCKVADSTTGQVLQYGKKGAGPAINVVDCVQTVINQGQITADKISQSCSVAITQTQNNGGTTTTTSGSSGASGGGGDQTTTSKAWIWILIAVIVVCASLILGGGGFFLISQQS